MTVKRDGNRAKILGVFIDSTQPELLIEDFLWAIENGEKRFVVTPNPEFLVLAHQNQWFKDILNEADLSIPDGVGLIFASRFLQTRPQLSRRIAGADLAADLLRLADQKKWRVGIIAARQGDQKQSKKLLASLQREYPGAMISNSHRGADLVFACHGMGEQEKWIAENIAGAPKGVFIGLGGSLDFLTGFARRAPFTWRQLGIEWLWRFFQRPARHARRLYHACLIFPYLVIKEGLGVCAKRGTTGR